MSKNAFTLVELVVTVSLISIALSIVALNTSTLQSLHAKQSLKVQSREVLQILTESRAASIMDGKTRKVLIFEDKIYVQTIDNEITTEKITFKPNISITYNTYAGLPLHFNSNGTVSKGGHFTFNNSRGDKMTIVVQIAGSPIYLKGGPA